MSEIFTFLHSTHQRKGLVSLCPYFMVKLLGYERAGHIVSAVVKADTVVLSLSIACNKFEIYKHLTHNGVSRRIS